MISITTARHWWIWVAVTVMDNRDVHISFGWTEEGARQKLIHDMDKYYES